MKELTERQKEVLSFITSYIKKHSYSPTVREIAEHFSISVKGAHDHITALKRKGYIKQTDKRPRTMGLTHGMPDTYSEMIKIPLLGSVAAGIPIQVEENFNGEIGFHRSMLRKNKEHFALLVKGDSMSGAGINDGDVAIIEKQETARNGEIVAVLVEDAAAIKRFYKENSRIKLQSENPDYPPRYSQDVRILGKLVTIVRSY